METFMIKSQHSLQHILHTLNITRKEHPKQYLQQQHQQPEAERTEEQQRGTVFGDGGGVAVTVPSPPAGGRNMGHSTNNLTLDEVTNQTSGYDEPASSTSNYTSLYYNSTDLDLANNGTAGVQYGFWFCAKWVDAQQDLFQAANLCFAIAFLVPKSFKQSILIVRALAAAGFLLLAAWAGTELCAPDVLAWNIVLVVINTVHTVLLIIRFLPPALSLELTELYLRLFKPLKVSKKHFKELAREARLLRLEPGEPYAIEGITPADERLSILIKGKLKVSCEQTYLHMIQPHQFVDSPEWEANREQSDDVFQVSVVAEEGSTCLCWPRMRLERVLRHRPMLKVVLDSIIGKDITHKLYSLNEQQILSAADPRVTQEQHIMLRSLSADAVDVGTRGKVRSLEWKTREKRGHNTTDRYSTARAAQEQWRPVASQFMPQSPFGAPRTPRGVGVPQLTSQASSSSLPYPPANAPLLSPPPPKRSLVRKTTSSLRKNREVKFVEPHETSIL